MIGFVETLTSPFIAIVIIPGDDFGGNLYDVMVQAHPIHRHYILGIVAFIGHATAQCAHGYMSFFICGEDYDNYGEYCGDDCDSDDDGSHVARVGLVVSNGREDLGVGWETIEQNLSLGKYEQILSLGDN